MTKETEDLLFIEARKMLAFSYAPYSRFHVGAALLADDGRIFTGCNIENASYGLANCAERTAFFKAVSEGVRKFEAIAIVGGKEGTVTDFCPPCGMCRQVMREFCRPEAFSVLLENGQGERKRLLLSELLPESFGPDQLA